MKSNNKSKRLFLLEPIFKSLAHCSLGCLFALAKAFSFVISHTNNRTSRQTKLNIRLCFAHKNKQQQKYLYQQSITHTACSLIEMACLWHQPLATVLGHIKSKSICSEYQTDTQAKIIIAPHFGSWEMLNLWLAEQGNYYALYKPARSEQLDNYILTMRSRNGAQLVSTNTAGLRALLKGLKKGASVMILPDQKPSYDSAKITSTFYGHDAITGLLLKSVMSKIKCNVYIAAAIRDLQTKSYRISIKTLDKNEFVKNDLEYANYLNKSIEQFIAVDESQYQWSYRRLTDKTYDQLTER